MCERIHVIIRQACDEMGEHIVKGYAADQGTAVATDPDGVLSNA